MDDTLKALKEDMLAFIDPGVAEVVERWSLPAIQTPSMWLIDKAGIAAAIRAGRGE